MIYRLTNIPLSIENFKKRMSHNNRNDDILMDKILHKKHFQCLISLVYPIDENEVEEFHTFTNIDKPKTGKYIKNNKLTKLKKVWCL